jgi:predicted permease
MHAMSGTTYDEPSGVTAPIFPYPAFELFRQHDAVFSTVFAHCAAHPVRRVSLTAEGRAEIVAGWSVSGDYFRGLGIAAAAGRLVVAEDDRPAAPPVAVLSYATARRRFGGAGEAVGRPILVDDLPFTVIGVAPPGFFGVDPGAAPDLWLPMHANERLGAGKEFGFTPDAYLEQNYYWVEVMGRLRPGVSLARAQAELAPAFAQWVAATAQNDRERANLPELVLTDGAAGLDSLRRRYSEPLFVLMALVGLILALACANVASLLLARAAARTREMALRISVGAGRLRLVRQLLTESVLLAALGGLVGMALAHGGVRLLALLLAGGRAGFSLQPDLNGRVLAAAAGLSLLTGILFGLAPALQATRLDVLPALQSTSAGRPRGARPLLSVPLARWLVSAQVALSLLLLVSAGLFARTLSNLHAVELGFARENVLLFRVDARKAGHTEPEIAAFYGELRRRLAALPGVEDATLSEDSLIEAGTGLPVGLAGAPPGPGGAVLSVGPRFFRTMRTPMVAGRDFDDGDRPGTPAVAIVNQLFAKARFGDRDPIGQRLTLWKDDRPARDMEIVGVSSNARYGGLTRDVPEVVYLPYDQGYPHPDQMVYALRTSGDPLGYAEAARDVVRQADPRVPVSEVRSQAADVDRTINQEILFARLCGAFAILALVIACVGLYGTVSYSVARRTSEIGLRMALGARREGVVRMVLGEVAGLAVGGVVLGLVAAVAASKLVASLLYGLTPNDPVTLALAAAVLLTAALLAGYAPARRASRIDPMTALRRE